MEIPGIRDLIMKERYYPYTLDREALQDIFSDFLNDIGCDCYGIPKNGSPADQPRTKDNATVDNPVFTIRPYYWGDDEDIMDLPNFVYKPENICITWYKYPLRGAECNVKLSQKKLIEILGKCKKAVLK